jgi:LysR family glycine cleavage system transcriptional activator
MRLVLLCALAGTWRRHSIRLPSLWLPASAIGKRIAALESLLGSELLQRGGKALQLTAGGRDYLAQVRPAMTLLMAVPQHRRPVQRARRLRVSSPPTFARQVLVPALGDFSSAHPGIELEVVLSIPFLDLRPGDADVEIQHAVPGTAGLDLLMRDVVLPVASPALAAGRRCDRPADLSRWPLLRTPLEPWTPWFRAAGLDWPEPSGGPMLVDLGLTLEAAIAGQGVALARPSLAGAWLASGTLRPLFDRVAEPAQQYCVRRGAGDDAAAFADWLGARCTRLAADALALVSGRA